MDSEPANDGPTDLFFADSDDGDGMDMNEESLQHISELSSGSSSEHRLFFPDGSDEDPFLGDQSFATPQKMPAFVQELSDSDVEIPSFDLEDAPKTSSVGTMSSSHASPASSPEPPAKDTPPPAKKRRISTSTGTPSSVLTSAYLGSFLVGNAWSTVKGKGYILNGEEVKIDRDEAVRAPTKASHSTTAGKAKKKDGKGKQLSIIAMMKKPQPKPSKKKTNTVVRLTNSRGFEFGRLPQEVASWISKLLDMGFIEFRGSTMIDCPPVLHSGADLIVSLSVYFRASAFKPPSTSVSDNTAVFSEGHETLDEQTLRERKHSLLRLFDAVGLKPCGGSDFALRRRETYDELHEEALKKSTQRPTNTEERGKKVKMEIVGDGEEVEVEEGEDLSESELDMIYKRAQKNDLTMGEMEAPDTFTLTLRGYQKQALLWMHSLETGEMAVREAGSMHPLWSEYTFPPEPHDGIIDLTADEKPFYFNPYSGELSLEFPKAEQKCRGGILADVGMGKTIMLSALIQMNHGPDLDGPDENAENKKGRQLKLKHAFRAVHNAGPSKGPSATLIVAPTSLLSQWSEELKRSSKPGTFKILVWHGQNRLDLEAAIADDHEDDKAIKVVVTSYGVLASEHAKSEKSNSHQSPVFGIEWLRVVTDEAHHCKSRSSKTARAVYALRARRRWAVTGTPIVNKLEDLYSILKFLGFTPWSDYPFFRSFITLPFLDRDPKAIEIVQVILESILLRREKNMRDIDGRRIVELPAKDVIVEHLEFSPLERQIYDSIYKDAKKNFEQLDAKGLISRNYTHILAMLMRLRRAVLHPNLVLSSDKNPEQSSGNGIVDVDALIKRFSDDASGEGTKNVFAEGVLANLGEDVDGECCICFDVMEVPMVVPDCMHQCCKDCIVAFLAACEERGEELRCPTCSRGPVQESDLLEVVRSKKEVGDDASTSSLLEVSFRRNDFRSSTKLEALMQNLRRLRDQDPCFRAVVFSQFTSFLDLIESVLRREDFDQYRFDGSMDVKKRTEAISGFKSPSKEAKVMIISLKAGGVGLNLTTANHVFLMDCWWNAATENQAIDRVHRIGQEKTVYVKHFIVANTIEGRILQIQKRKTAIVREAFRGKGKMSGEDPESVENLKIMFGDD